MDAGEPALVGALLLGGAVRNRRQPGSDGDPGAVARDREASRGWPAENLRPRARVHEEVRGMGTTCWPVL